MPIVLYILSLHIFILVLVYYTPFKSNSLIVSMTFDPIKVMRDVLQIGG